MLVDENQSSRSTLPPKKYHTNSSRRLSGRPSYDGISQSLHSISSLSSIGSSLTLDAPEPDARSGESNPHQHVRHHHRASNIVSQVAEWLHHEKWKRAAHKARKHSGHTRISQAAEAVKSLDGQTHSDESNRRKSQHRRTDSDLSDRSLALEKLEQILSKAMHVEGDGIAALMEEKKDSYFPRRKSTSKRQGSKKLFRKGSTVHSSDTEYQEPDTNVPSAEVVLDNSKTLGYSGGTTDSEVDLLNPKKRAVKENEAWLQFKHEIVRLTHTLRLKGWRRLPFDRSGDIDVERLSGALTNAVYVVSPPLNLPDTPSITDDGNTSTVPKKPPS